MTGATAARPGYQLIHADAGAGIPLKDNSIDACVCSPPYLGLRKYQGVDPTPWPAVRFAPMPGLEPVTVPAMTCCLGNESDPMAFVAHLVHVFRDVRRVLSSEGVAVINMGDCYSNIGRGHEKRRKDTDGVIRPIVDSVCERCGRPFSGGPARRFCSSYCGGSDNSRRSSRPVGLKSGDLMGIPWRLAFALQADSWLLRSAPPWIKPDNAMPESVTSRPGTAHEMIFILAKSDRYYWDADAVRRPGVTTAEQARTKWAARRNGTGKGQQEGVYHPSKNVMPFSNDPNPAGRNLRTSDIFMDALDECIAWHRSRAAELEAARDRGGMIVGAEGEAAAILANPQSFKGNHFATFSSKLISPFIRAATSEHGHCSACGRGLRRVVEREEIALRPKSQSNRGNDASSTCFLGQPQRGSMAVNVSTLGWSPACSCNAPPRPAVVLDPFGGSMSTVVAALALGRNAIGIDASLDYIKMGKARLDRPHARVGSPGVRSEEKLPLFDGL